MRVYELAKELNMKSVELVDKIRKDWKLPVRSYMEVLTPEFESKIRRCLDEEKKKKPLEKKKLSVKKTVRRSAAPKAVKKKPRQIKKASESKTPSAQSEKPPAAVKKTKSIIRRKAADVKPLPQADLPVEKLKEKKEEPEDSPPASAVPKKDQVSFKEELRSFSAKTDEEPAPLESAEEKKKNRLRSEKDQSVKKFQASDFRKREVIFQPKKKKNLQDRFSKKTIITKPKQHKRVVKFFGGLSVNELAHNMGVKTSQLIQKLKNGGVPADNDTILDFDTAVLTAADFGFEVKNQEKTYEEFVQDLRFGDLKAVGEPCPPIVTVMGHVDHGKTTLLDCLRKTNKVEGEAGGITQHIGAYNVTVGKSSVTFVDTPGHEAFSAMRARGARLTDIVVLVTAADDGVSSQTVEAIEHAKKANVPILVAINKMDKPGADPEKVKKQMSEHGLVAEEWGGDVLFVSISALKGTGMKELLEQILLLSEMQEIKANPKQSAEGVVLESRMVKGRGWAADLIVKNGTLKKSQYIMTPSLLGRVRQMMNDQGKIVSSAGPGIPVEVSGFDEAPKAGDVFFAVKSDKPAREFLSLKKQKLKPIASADVGGVENKSPEELLQFHTRKTKELALVVKADAAGSLEAVKNSLSQIASEEVRINIIHSGLGGITESDVLLAAASMAEVVGFNVRPDSKAEKAVKDYKAPLSTYTVIYELLEGVKERAVGILDPNVVEEVSGKVEVREVFSISGLGRIAGSYVLSGKVSRQNLVRLIRDGRVVHEGKISSLRRFKDDVKEVSEKYECGIGIDQYNDIKAGDMIEAYTKKEIARTEL